MARVRRLSGLQREVLSLYRTALRAANNKGEAAADFKKLAKQEFRKNQSISRKDIPLVEHLIRVGKRQIKAYESPNVTNIKI